MQLNFTPFPTLITERLILRAIEMSDDKELFLLRSNDEVNKYVGNPKPASIEEIHAFIQKLQDNATNNVAILWAICTKDDPKLIGTACFWNISKENETMEIGYTLLPHAWGNGYMNEVVSALITYGFNTIQAKSIEAFTHKDNAASSKLLERNGFKRDKELEEKNAGNEDEKDLIVYSLHKQ
jgi:ribosomal-protein-alanine N-acetyltransferase